MDMLFYEYKWKRYDSFPIFVSYQENRNENQTYTDVVYEKKMIYLMEIIYK